MRFGFVLAGALAAAFSMAGTARAEDPHFKVFDPSLFDRTASPCEDLYQFACGGWLKTHPVPPDIPLFDRSRELALYNRALLRSILDDAVAHPTPANRKVADFYAACTDEAAVEAKGLAPLQPELDRIAALKDKQELPALVAHLQEIGVTIFFQMWDRPDAKDAAHSIAVVDQGGLGLPDRDYYFKTDDKTVQQRTAYEAHVVKMLGLLGDAPDQAAAEAKAILALETALAEPSLKRVDRRDPDKVYHKEPLEELKRSAPDFGWDAYFTAAATPRFTDLNVAVPDFVKGLDGVVQSTSLDTIKAYLRWHLVDAAAPMLPKAFVDENFAFAQMLNGAKELEPRWRRCVIATDHYLGEALGKLYVEKAFGPDSKARMKGLVRELRVAYAADIRNLPWMGEETRRKALEKLDAMVDKIGYPDKWRDYSALVVKPDDALGNLYRATAFERHRRLAHIGQPVDRMEWGMTPPTVNAYYNSYENNINFPAGILQPPFFNLAEDDAANYGSTGATIGHEMTHGFDDEGRKFGKDGNRTDWWTAEDAEKFKTRDKCLADQASAYTVVDDVKMNGELTLGENTADNGGLRIAYAAYKLSTKGKKLEDIDGFTPDQRFFVAYAQGWCTNETPEIARFYALNDPHPADKFRVNGVVSNMPEFASAFKCKPAAAMVHTPACRVW